MKVSGGLLPCLLLASVVLLGGCKTTSTSSGGSAGGMPSAGGPAGGGAPASGGESAGAESSGGAAMPGESPAGGGEPGATGAGTAEEDTGAGGRSIEDLDGELDSSLEDFDERVSDAGTESGEVDILDPSGRNTGGVAANVPVFEEAEVGSGDVENPEIETRAEEGFEGAAPAADDTVAGSGAAGGETYPVPEGIGDGQGDDIVLRQIREAAMAESDPELREKLWDEYRRIKGER